MSTVAYVGQRFFQASILVKGRDVDDHVGTRCATRAEAEADGEVMVGEYDPEWQKRHPGCVEWVVREYEVLAVDEDGTPGVCITR